MSFPRAKLNRFNDVQSDVPSPTRYDPKLDKTKGGLIAKVGDQRERTQSSQSDTVGGTPFRTPFSAVKKHSCVASSTEKSLTARCVNFGESGTAPIVHTENDEYPVKGEMILELENTVLNLRLKVSEMEKKLTELELEKAALESAAVNSDNYETQIQELNGQIKVLEDEISAAQSEKKEFLSQKCDIEAKLEQFQIECQHHQKESQNLRDGSEKLELRIQFLAEKISSLESSKSNDEQTILALNTQVAALNANLETAQLQHTALEERLGTLLIVLDKMKSDCKQHEETIMGLDMQLEHKAEEDRKFREITEENIRRLNENWEKKYSTLLEEKEDCLLEKNAVIQLADLEYTKRLGDTKTEWEKKLLDAELESNRRQSEQLEEIERLRLENNKQICNLEKALEAQSKETQLENCRYEEMVNEVNVLVETVGKKDKYIAELSTKNDKLSSRLSNMLEEVKLLNAAVDENAASLNDMATKYEAELKKNEKLSEQLGEIDSKVLELENDLKDRTLKNSKLKEEITSVRAENKDLKTQNLNLTHLSETQNEKINSLHCEVNENRIAFDKQILKLVEELDEIKRQRRKFEIAMSDTRKSLEALGKRLIESESDVERLTHENGELIEKLSAFESEKFDVETRNIQLLETKIDLEQRLSAAENIEDSLRLQVKELELKNCDLELNRNEVIILKEALEHDKEAADESLKTLRNLVNEQNIKMIQMERLTLEQVETVTQELMTKLEQFECASKQHLQKLVEEGNVLRTEKLNLKKCYDDKCEEYNNLFTDYDILKTTIDIARKESDSLKKHYEEQQIQLDSNILKLNDLGLEKEELSKKLDNITAVYDDKCLEVVRMHNEAKDLREDVERLNAEVLTKKAALDAANAKILDCKQELASLKEEMACKVEKLEMSNNELNTKLVEANEELSILKIDLENERCSVNELKESVKNLSEKEKNLLIANESKENQLKTKWEQLLNEKELLNQELATLSDRKDFYKSHCRRLEERVAAVTADEETAMHDFYKINDILKEKEEENARLLKTISELESLIEPFREQLEQFEMERNLIENDRDQLRRQHLEQAAKLGHQNNKQKIQHVVKLKRDLLELKKDNERLQVELKSRNKTVEKLREQLGEHPKRLFIGGKRPTSTPFKGKENGSPVLVKHEPMSPSSPLRNRNQ